LFGVFCGPKGAPEHGTVSPAAQRGKRGGVFLPGPLAEGEERAHWMDENRGRPNRLGAGPIFCVGMLLLSARQGGRRRGRLAPAAFTLCFGGVTGGTGRTGLFGIDQDRGKTSFAKGRWGRGLEGRPVAVMEPGEASLGDRAAAAGGGSRPADKARGGAPISRAKLAPIGL